MKNVLVIAYFFPPMGFSGVQRPLKFVKYLADYGWRATVLTTDAHAYYAFDDSLLEDLRERDVAIWRLPPSGIFKVVKGRKTLALNNERLRFVANRVSQFFFIPDNKGGWRRRALQYLSGNKLKAFDAIFTTAPPFSSHLLAQDLKDRSRLPVVADFRDAWLDYPYYRYWTSWHRQRHARMERRVVEGSDAVITTNPFVRNTFLERYAEADPKEKIHVIEQGFDPEDFALDRGPSFPPSGPDEINYVYSGNFYEDRRPYALYEALVIVKQRYPEWYAQMRFTMVGYVQEQFRARADELGIGDRFAYCGYVDHTVAVARLKQADVVWFNIGADDKGFETVAPGKVFEYIGSAKPILAIVPPNEIRTILQGFAQAFVIPPGNSELFADTLVYLARLKSDNALPKGNSEQIDRFNRQKLTGKLAAILDQVSGP